MGIILPFTSSSASTRALAGSMLKAAELAMFTAGNRNILLMTADEGNGGPKAADAAQQLLSQGAEVIVGPLFGPSVSAVAPIARDRAVPVLAFSTEKNVAGNGAYLLSFLPQNEVRRVVAYAAANGHHQFAALAPQTAYGDVAQPSRPPCRWRAPRATRSSCWAPDCGMMTGRSHANPACRAVGMRRPRPMPMPSSWKNTAPLSAPLRRAWPAWPMMPCRWWRCCRRVRPITASPRRRWRTPTALPGSTASSASTMTAPRSAGWRCWKSVPAARWWSALRRPRSSARTAKAIPQSRG
ncbi:MAG: penicillin-binding protein activator [Alphaproteobacteria bacterium]|nr:penicillin-binding protein activator [Alphaproteobacteria bacterium]